MISQISAERLATFNELTEMLTKDVCKPLEDQYVDFLSGYFCDGEHPYLINSTIKLLNILHITLRQVELFELEDLVEQFGTDHQAKIDFVMKISRMEIDEHMKEYPLEDAPNTFIPIATSTPKRPEDVRRVAFGAARKLF